MSPVDPARACTLGLAIWNKACSWTGWSWEGIRDVNRSVGYLLYIKSRKATLGTLCTIFLLQSLNLVSVCILYQVMNVQVHRSTVPAADHIWNLSDPLLHLPLHHFQARSTDRVVVVIDPFLWTECLNVHVSGHEDNKEETNNSTSCCSPLIINQRNTHNEIDKMAFTSCLGTILWTRGIKCMHLSLWVVRRYASNKKCVHLTDPHTHSSQFYTVTTD